MEIRNKILTLEAEVNRQIIGQEAVVRRLLICLLADGNLLLEGLPGLAKTRAIKRLAACLDSSLSRIQFTPDLLPADVTGTEVLDANTGSFHFRKGPVFSNLVLADEINRAPAKVQSALLEAMQEGQVTINGKSHALPQLFLVMATQNPVEQEGTYPLPEAQMDRFLMHVTVSYPSPENELEVLRLVRREEQGDLEASFEHLDEGVIFEARAAIREVTVSEPIENYIVQLVHATRFPLDYDSDLKRYLDYGASPRGTLALDKCARALAWLNGRDYVIPEDVQKVAVPVLRHRIIPSYEANAQNIGRDAIISLLLQVVPVV